MSTISHEFDNCGHHHDPDDHPHHLHAYPDQYDHDQHHGDDHVNDHVT